MIIIDVRTLEEYQEAHVKGAINLPLNDLLENTPLAKEILDRIRSSSVSTANDVTSGLNMSIKVHCASGGRSAVACAVLHKLGFTNVENLGGYDDACRCVEEGK